MVRSQNCNWGDVFVFVSLPPTNNGRIQIPYKGTVGGKERTQEVCSEG